MDTDPITDARHIHGRVGSVQKPACCPGRHLPLLIPDHIPAAINRRYPGNALVRLTELTSLFLKPGGQSKFAQFHESTFHFSNSGNTLRNHGQPDQHAAKLMTVTSLPDKLFLANNSLGIRIFTNTLNLRNKIK
jgi:hypothetical protein